MSKSLLETYENKIAEGELIEDSGQREALNLLIELEKNLSLPDKRGGLFGLKKPSIVPGVYLWGGVGRGKSMLMDMFFSHSQVKSRMRRHFLEFMQGIHSQMNEARKQGVNDAIFPVAKEISSNNRLLCLDECQVNDIADAMIVGRLFKLVIEQGTVVVTTSNRHPFELYKDGINRHLFLPFIELIQEKLKIHKIGDGQDHRQIQLSGETGYFVPAGPHSANHINEIWLRLTNGESHPFALHVQGRQLVLEQFFNGVSRAEFWNLCGQPYGPADYLAISKSVRVLIIENIPLLSRSNYNEARRFVMLIDALYEAKVRLIVSAAAKPEKLYVEGVGSFEFERTASRLYEMQSGHWS